MCGAIVSALWAWVESVPTTPDHYEGLGAALFAVVVGVPAVLGTAILGFWWRRVRVPLVTGPIALGVWFVAVGIAENLSGLDASPVLVVATAAVSFALVAWLVTPGRTVVGRVMVVAVAAAVFVVSQPVAHHHRQDRAERSIRGTGLPVFTTEVEGHHLRLASGSTDPAEIHLLFQADQVSDTPSLDPSASVLIVRRPPAFDPPARCDVAVMPIAGAGAASTRPCESVAPHVWWSEARHSAVRDEGDVVVVIRPDWIHPQSKTVLVEAATRVRPIDPGVLAREVR